MPTANPFKTRQTENVLAPSRKMGGTRWAAKVELDGAKSRADSDDYDQIAFVNDGGAQQHDDLRPRCRMSRSPHRRIGAWHLLHQRQYERQNPMQGA